METEGEFEVTGETEFTAYHHLRTYRGESEEPHKHNFRVRVVLASSGLDGDGIAFDFTLLESILSNIRERFNQTDLNTVPPFGEINPTAEHIAAEIASTVAREIPKNAGARVKMVEVWELTGFSARYYPR